MSHLRQSHATLMRDKGSRVKVASVTGRVARWDVARRSRVTYFWNRALHYSMRLWRASESRVKGATLSQVWHRRCDIGITASDSSSDEKCFL